MITRNSKAKGNLNPKSYRGLLVILRCKTFFLTHGSADFYWTKMGKDPRRLFIMLYHGTAVKADGILGKYKEWKFQKELSPDGLPSIQKEFAFKSKKIIRDEPYRLYWIVASKLERYFISASLRFPLERCVPIGHLQNDLYDSQSQTDSHWEELVKAIIRGYDKVILYAPTFRLSLTNNSPYLPFLEDFSLNRLEQVLKKHNAILLCRYHINTQKMVEASNKRLDSPSIKNTSFRIIPYVAYLLKYADLLITDYSGIIYDFLHLNRPILALANDWENYNRMRGFRLQFDRTFPGKIIQNFSELLENIEEGLINPQKDQQKRKFWYQLFRDFSDAKNSQRMYRLLPKLIGN
jgi:CDP-glycerol glycerophosphotransferase